jgi:hypothetical protein
MIYGSVYTYVYVLLASAVSQHCGRWVHLQYRSPTVKARHSVSSSDFLLKYHVPQEDRVCEDTRWFTFTASPIHGFIDSMPRPFTVSRVHGLTGSLTQGFHSQSDIYIYRSISAWMLAGRVFISPSGLPSTTRQPFIARHLQGLATLALS